MKRARTSSQGLIRIQVTSKSKSHVISSSHDSARISRIAIVLVYIVAVSLAAILLSIYYTFFWFPYEGMKDCEQFTTNNDNSQNSAHILNSVNIRTSLPLPYVRCWIAQNNKNSENNENDENNSKNENHENHENKDDSTERENFTSNTSNSHKSHNSHPHHSSHSFIHNQQNLEATQISLTWGVN